VLKIAFIGLAIFLTQNAFSQSSGTVVESCHKSAKADSNRNIAVKIYLDDRGHYAEVIDKNTQATLATKVPVVLTGDRKSPSWYYTTPVSLMDVANGLANLEVYRSNESERTPTTVNAFFDYVNLNNGISLKSYPMECEK
jgi:hypothetical protein